MALRILLLAIAAVGSASPNLVLDRPRETRPARSYSVNGWTPLPTSEPYSGKAGLRRAAMDGNQLFKRSYSVSATCGYISKDAYQSLTCNNGWGCAYWANDLANSISHGITQAALQCCPVIGSADSFQFDSCVPPVTCVDYNSRINSAADPITTDGTMHCGFAGKICATFQFIGAPSGLFGEYDKSSSLAAATYTNLYCDNDSYIQEVYQVTTNVISSSTKPPPSSSTSSSTKTDPKSSSSSTSSKGDGGGGGSGGSSSNVGVIAGATVGGVVAIAAVGAVVGFLVWRKKRQSIPPTREISTYEGSTYGGGAGGSLYSPVPQGQEYGQPGYGPPMQQNGYAPPGSYGAPGSQYGGSNQY